MMNRSQIERKFTKEKRFLGVYAADKIPKLIPSGYGVIINLDPSNKPGSHWVGVYKSVLLEYFDPLGNPPPNSVNFKGPVLCNRKKIQDANSISCGKFAIDFVKRRIKGESFSSIQHFWSKNKIFNDLLL